MTEPLPLDLDGLDLSCPPQVMTPGHRWEWRCWVPGVPAPQGSKNMIPVMKGPRGHQVPTGKYRLVESSSKALGPWRKQITKIAKQAWTVDPCDVPVLIGAMFLLPAWTTARGGDWPVGSRTGDWSHLLRALEDALTDAKVWVDDRLVVGPLGWPDSGKRFARPGEESGCEIIVRAAVPVPDQWRGFRPPVRHKAPR